MIDFIKAAARVVPEEKQLKWFEMEQYAFVHFGVNTFTDREWGDGTEPESVFNPEKLDCDQWVAAIKSAGLKGMVLTAKHHDGFCLWPSAFTEHSVKNSPCRRDIVREASDACRRGGIRFGFYLSPWDRNCKLYGTPEYNDYFCSQLTELLTNYGEIFYVWFDNACGEGENGKKQVYDFPRYFELIRKYQPGAVIFNDFGPDIRWCGNEAGSARASEWSVVPTDLCRYARSQTGGGPLAEAGELSYLYNSNKTLGDLHQILYAKGLAFVPSEIDTSIRKGWFWHEYQQPKSLRELFQIYLNSVGHNACLHLNIPPNREGLIDARDVARLKEYGDFLKKTFARPIACTMEEVTKPGCRQPEYLLKLEKPAREISFVVLREDLAQGQRVENFMVYAKHYGGHTFPMYQGNTIGNKKICCLTDPFAEQNPLLEGQAEGNEIRIKITASRDVPVLKCIEVY